MLAAGRTLSRFVGINYIMKATQLMWVIYIHYCITFLFLASFFFLLLPSPTVWYVFPTLEESVTVSLATLAL